MKSWLDLNAFMGIAAIHWVYAVGAVAASYVLLVYILRFAVDRFTVLSRRTSTQYDDILVEILRRTHKLVLLIAAILIGAKFLPLSQRWDNRFGHLWLLLVVLQFALWISRGVSLWTLNRLQAADSLAHNPVLTTMIGWSVKRALWSVLLLAVLANMGVNITAFVASLDVGGVALALAVQSILSDLLASLTIGPDKPFETGDFIVFGDVAGSIDI